MAVNVPGPIEDRRPLTQRERELTQWMLENSGHPDAPKYLEQLEHARVVSRCPCGCASVDFEVDGYERPTGGLHILGDYLVGQGDKLYGVRL